MPSTSTPLYGGVKASEKSPKSIRNHHATISAALHQGVRWRWVLINVAELARPPRTAGHRPRARVSYAAA